MYRSLILSFFLLLSFMVSREKLFAQQIDTDSLSPQAQIIALNLQISDYHEIFHGPPETISLHSGLVTLDPGEITETHDSKDFEEIIVIFEGSGQMNLASGESLDIKYGVIAYCPPNTEHYITNTGSTPLKYLYIAAKTKFD